jgi:hypothetical protein
VRDGVNFIIVDFSVISLIKADIFSLFHRRAFPEKAKVLKELSCDISTAITYIFQKSLDTGKIP